MPMFLGCSWATGSSCQCPPSRSCSSGMLEGALGEGNTAQGSLWWHPLLKRRLGTGHGLPAVGQPPQSREGDSSGCWGRTPGSELSLQVADLLRGQRRVSLLFCTRVRAQHESFYTTAIKPVSTLHRQLVSTKKLSWACGYFFPSHFYFQLSLCFY